MCGIRFGSPPVSISVGSRYWELGSAKLYVLPFFLQAAVLFSFLLPIPDSFLNGGSSRPWYGGCPCSRAGNKPTRSLKYHNHGYPYLGFWWKVPTYACPFSTITSRCFQPGEGPIMGRGPLCNCEASNFVKVRFQLYVRVVYAGLQPLSVFPARMYSVSSVYTNSDRSCLI